MKKLIMLLMFIFSVSFADTQNASIYKVLEDSTSSGITEGSLVPDEQRPAGFIIKHVKDEDNDGILGKDDKCPDTPDGKVVNSDGCIKIIRINVRFDFDKSNIKNEYKDEIEEAVKFLKDNSTFTATVEGHTDSTGTFTYNQALSERRAKAVATTLEQEGISPLRIEERGFGETIPVASNETKEGRAQNRRVDISFNKPKVKK